MTIRPPAVSWLARNPAPARYELLDGIRGVACLVVVLHHMGVVTVGHMAVMVFFVISGYCITASTDAGLRAGMGFGEMMARRVRRIYPPYLLAVAFFVVTRLIKTVIDPQFVWQPTWQQWLQNLTLTQWLSLPVGNYVEASQNSDLFVASFWSLNYEEQFYLIMAGAMWLASRYDIGLKRVVLALAVVGLTWNIIIPGGWVSGLFIEYWVHFSLGGLLYFVLTSRHQHQAWRGFMLILTGLGLVIGLSGLPWQGDDLWGSHRALLELVVVVVVTLVLALLRPASEIISRNILWRPFAAVGAISYSLYLVHQFNLHLVESVVGYLLPLAAPRVLVVTAMVLLHITIGASFWWFCERPFLRRTRSTRNADHARLGGWLPKQVG